MQIFEYCMERFSKEELDLMAVLARRIWLRRIALVFEGLFTHPNSVYTEAATSLEEFKQCTTKELQIIQPDELEPNRCKNGWQHPPNGVIKVNWDASLNKKDGCVGLEIIARDSAGGFLGARSVTLKMMTEPKIAEVMATLCVVNFSKDVGFFFLCHFLRRSIAGC